MVEFGLSRGSDGKNGVFPTHTGTDTVYRSIPLRVKTILLGRHADCLYIMKTARRNRRKPRAFIIEQL